MHMRLSIICLLLLLSNTPFIYGSDDISILHGYYPKEFSDHTISNYWMTPQEVGHYILGNSQPLDHYISVADKPAVVSINDTSQVHVIRPHRMEMERKQTQINYHHRPTRINDSFDLPKVIEEHSWNLPACLSSTSSQLKR